MINDVKSHNDKIMAMISACTMFKENNIGYAKLMYPEHTAFLDSCIGREYGQIISELLAQLNPPVIEKDRSYPEYVMRAKRNRRPNLNFYKMGITKGSVIISLVTGEEAIVNSERTVLLRNAEVSLTDATTTILGGKYRNPCTKWTYKGRCLHELYEAVN